VTQPPRVAVLPRRLEYSAAWSSSGTTDCFGREMPLLDPPRWRARSESDKRWMHAWVNQELNILALAGRHPPSDEEIEKDFASFNAWLETPLAAEIAAAEEDGDIEPLRRALPHLAKFLQLPKQPDGVRRPKVDEDSQVVLMAANDVPRIRALWQQHYHKKNRKAGDVTAEEIAAERWGV
jgi:hypothetical protein